MSVKTAISSPHCQTFDYQNVLSAAYSVTDAINSWLSPSNNRGALCVTKKFV